MCRFSADSSPTPCRWLSISRWKLPCKRHELRDRKLRDTGTSSGAIWRISTKQSGVNRPFSGLTRRGCHTVWNVRPSTFSKIINLIEFKRQDFDYVVFSLYIYIYIYIYIKKTAFVTRQYVDRNVGKYDHRIVGVYIQLDPLERCFTKYFDFLVQHRIQWLLSRCLPFALHLQTLKQIDVFN